MSSTNCWAVSGRCTSNTTGSRYRAGRGAELRLPANQQPHYRPQPKATTCIVAVAFASVPERSSGPQTALAGGVSIAI